MSAFPGLAQHVPGAFNMRRRFTNETKAAFGVLNFRENSSWFADCELCTPDEQVAAALRGEIKRVEITVETGTVEASNRPNTDEHRSRGTGGTQFATILLEYLNQHGRFEIWWQTVGGAATFEIEVFFDIPRAEDV